MNVLTIDPGYAKAGKGCACALGSGGGLVGTFFQRPERWAHHYIVPLEEVIVEQPQQDGRTWSIPPEVMIRLSWDGALLAGLYAGEAGCPVIAWTPSNWKGSAHKPQQHAKMWGILSPKERQILGGEATWRMIDTAVEKGALDRWHKAGGDYYPKSWLEHNLLDAAAMLMVRYGRLTK